MSEKMRGPFRLSLRDAAPGTARMLKEIAEERAPSDERLRGWLGHADEQVVLAASARHRAWIRGFGVSGELRERVARSRRVEPGIWTPMLDRHAGILLLDTSDEERAMARWFRHCTTEEATAVLNWAESDVPGFVAAKECRKWDGAMVDAILQSSPRAYPRMGGNRHLTDDELLARLFRGFLARLRGEPGGQRVSVMDGAARSCGPGDLRGGLERLLRRDPDLPADAEARLMDVVRAGTHRWRSMVAARALGSRPGVPDALARELVERGKGQAWIVAEFLKGGGCSDEMVLHALREVPRLPVFRAAIRNKDVLARTEARRILSRSRCARVLSALIETADAEEGAHLIGRLSQSNPERAMDAIEERLPDGAAVPAQAMARLLGNNSPKLRERAIAAMGKVERPARRR